MISDKTGWVRNAKQKVLSTIKVIIRLVTRFVVDTDGKMGVLSTQIPESLLYWAFPMDNDFRNPVSGLLLSQKHAFLCRLSGRSADGRIYSWIERPKRTTKRRFSGRSIHEMEERPANQNNFPKEGVSLTEGKKVLLPYLYSAPGSKSSQEGRFRKGSKKVSSIS